MYHMYINHTYSYANFPFTIGLMNIIELKLRYEKLTVYSFKLSFRGV